MIRDKLVVIIVSVFVMVFLITSILLFLLFKTRDKTKTVVPSNINGEINVSSNVPPEQTQASINFDKLVGELVPTKGVGDYWTNWDWKTDLFFADIVLSSVSSKSMIIKINQPSNQTFSGQEINVEVKCDEKDSARYSSNNLILVASNIDISNFANKGDKIYSYCLNTDCTVIGGVCILIE